MLSVKRKMVEMLSCIEVLRKEVVKYCDEAGSNNDLSLLKKANEVKKYIKGKVVLSSELESTIANLEKLKP